MASSFPEFIVVYSLALDNNFIFLLDRITWKFKFMPIQLVASPAYCDSIKFIAYKLSMHVELFILDKPKIFMKY